MDGGGDCRGNRGNALRKSMDYEAEGMKLKVSGRKNLFGSPASDVVLEVNKVREPISKTGYVYRIGFPNFIGAETMQELVKKVKSEFRGKVTIVR